MDFVLDRLPSMPHEQLEEFGWCREADGRSPNMLPTRDPLRVQRRPVANSTDGVRAKKALAMGRLHIWEVRWPQQQRGTYAAIGVGTAKAALQADGYCALLGMDSNSFGWDIVGRKCWHEGRHWDYPKGAKAGKKNIGAAERLFCILDMHKGTLAFATQHEHLGIAFRGLHQLPGQPALFPMAAAVWGNAQVAIRYLGSAEDELTEQLEELSDDVDTMFE